MSETILSERDHGPVLLPRPGLGRVPAPRRSNGYAHKPFDGGVAPVEVPPVALPAAAEPDLKQTTKPVTPGVPPPKKAKVPRKVAWQAWQGVFKSFRPNPHQVPFEFELRREWFRRRPDWRWLRATMYLIRGELPGRHPDNKGLYPVVQFQRLLRGCDSEQRYLNLENYFPALLEAYQIHTTPNESLLAELQARLLANEGFPSIAKKLSITEQGVRRYEELFYNVLDRLDAPGWIVNCAIGGDIHCLGEDDVDILIRLYGYHCGPLVVDELVADFSAPTIRPATKEEVRKCLDSDIQATLLRKVALAVRMLPAGDHKRTCRMLRLYLRMQEVENRRREKIAQYADITKNIEVAYQQLQARYDFLQGKDWDKWYGVSKEESDKQKEPPPNRDTGKDNDPLTWPLG